MAETDEIYWAKAGESLAGADSEFANGRLNDCANRSYYACFQAAVYALMKEGIRPSGARPQWGHDFVQAQFIGELINRRKRYSPQLRETLVRNLEVREAGDYRANQVSETQAFRALRRAGDFVRAIEQRGGGQ
ncbi:MAG: HEPN domain-containing protein [Chloroflexota bacterium]